MDANCRLGCLMLGSGWRSGELQILPPLNSAATRGGGALSRDTCGVSWGVSTLSVIVRMHSEKIRHRLRDGLFCSDKQTLVLSHVTTVANVHP